MGAGWCIAALGVIDEMEKVIASPEGVPPGGRNDALNHGAWTLGRWIVAGAFELADVEDALCA